MRNYQPHPLPVGILGPATSPPHFGPPNPHHPNPTIHPNRTNKVHPWSSGATLSSQVYNRKEKESLEDQFQMAEGGLTRIVGGVYRTQHHGC